MPNEKEKLVLKKPDVGGQELEQSRSRRGFFKWIGQVAAGASLASIGLGLTNIKNALANCIVCDGCQVISCMASGTCRAEDPLKPVRVTYKLFYGCVTGGSCPYNIYDACNSSCSCVGL